MYQTTVTLGTSTVLDYLGMDDDSLTTMATTASTSLTAAQPAVNYHYYITTADSYVNSLSDEELAKLTRRFQDNPDK